MKSRKQKVEEHIPTLNRHGEPATAQDGLYEIAYALERETAAIQDVANALWAIKKLLVKSRVEDAGDLGRIYHAGTDDFEKGDIKHRVERAKKILSRKS